MSFELTEGKIFDKEIGLRIRGLRDNIGWTREKLAEEADISRTTVYLVENGRRGTTAETLAKICWALNASSDYILYGIEDKKLLKSQRERIKANLQESITDLQESIDNLQESINILNEG